MEVLICGFLLFILSILFVFKLTSINFLKIFHKKCCISNFKMLYLIQQENNNLTNFKKKLLRGFNLVTKIINNKIKIKTK